VLTFDWDILAVALLGLAVYALAIRTRGVLEDGPGESGAARRLAAAPTARPRRTTLTPGDVEAELRRTVPAAIQDGSRAAAQGLGACDKYAKPSPAAARDSRK